MLGRCWWFCAIAIILNCQTDFEPLDKNSGQNFATINLHIKERVNSEPLSARLTILRHDKTKMTCFKPDAGFSGWSVKRQKWAVGADEVSLYIRGDSETTSFRVLPGQYTIIVNRGNEYRPEQTTVNAEEGETKELDITLEPWIDLSKKGFYSGDFHLHIGRFRADQDRQVSNLLEAEDLDISALVDWAGRAKGEPSHHWGGWQWEVGKLNKRRAFEKRLFFTAQQWAIPERACELGLFGHETPVFGTSKRSRATISQNVLDEGGLIVGSLGRTFVPGALLSKVSAVEILAMGKYQKLEDWYALLNAGAKLAAVAGSDAQSSGDPQQIIHYYAPPGANRFYVNLGEENLTVPTFLDGIRRGKTFVTSGPALFLEVEGNGPGDEVRLDKSRTIRCKVRVEGPFPLDGRVKLIRNGSVVSEQQAEGNLTSLEHIFRVEINESSWIAARYDGTERVLGSEIPTAHTSPVYITVEDRPIFVQKTLSELIKRIPTREEIVQSGFATEEDKRISVDWAEQARQILSDRARMSQSKSSLDQGSSPP